MNLNQLDWQTVVALLIVLAAIGVLVRKTWKTVFSRVTAGCGTSCNSCPANSGPSESSIKITNLVQLDSDDSKQGNH